MEYLTLGQVIDTMELDEVAVVVNDNIEEIEDYLKKFTGNRKRKVANVLRFNREGELVSYDGCKLRMTYTEKALVTNHVILKRKVYESIINKQ